MSTMNGSAQATGDPTAKPSHLKKIVYFVVIVAVASPIGYSSGNFVYRLVRPDEREVSQPRLAISEEALHLGRVYEATAYEHSVPITNPTDLPLTITRFDTTCTCLGVTPGPGVTLEPRETRTFTAKLKLVSKKSLSSPSQEEPFTVSFGAVFSSDGKKTFSTSWQVDCVIVPTIHLIPFQLDLGSESCRREAIERSVIIQATKEIQWIEHEAPPLDC